MKINMVGLLNEGRGREVLEEKEGIHHLTEEGKRSIQYVRRDIVEFLRSRQNISDYLSIVSQGEKDEYQFDEAIFEAVKNKEDNKFVSFLNKNSEKIRDIAITTRHTGLLVVLEISAYIRDYLLGAGEISCNAGKFAVYQK